MEEPDVIFVGSKDVMRPNDVLPDNYFDKETQRRLASQTRQINRQHDKNNNSNVNDLNGPTSNGIIDVGLFNGHVGAEEKTDIFRYMLPINNLQHDVGVHELSRSTSTNAQPDIQARLSALFGTVLEGHHGPYWSNDAWDLRKPVSGASTNAQPAQPARPVQVPAASSTVRATCKNQRNNLEPVWETAGPVPIRRNPVRKVRANLPTETLPNPNLVNTATMPGPSSNSSNSKANRQTIIQAHADGTNLIMVNGTVLPDLFSNSKAGLHTVIQARGDGNNLIMVNGAVLPGTSREHTVIVNGPTIINTAHKRLSAKNKAQTQDGRRRKNAKVEEDPEPKGASYQYLLNLQSADLVSNTEDTHCGVCQESVLVGKGVILKDCLHNFCRKCLQNAILCSQMAQVRCPFVNADYACESHLQDREVKSLVSKEDYERHLARSVFQARCQATNAFYCMTPNCAGWCLIEEGSREFVCPVCKRTNCVICADIHEGTVCNFLLPGLYPQGPELVPESPILDEVGNYSDLSNNPCLDSAFHTADYHNLLELNDMGLVTNKEKFDCPICFCDIEVGEGVVLKDCLHNYCRECLAGTIRHSETVLVKCPFVNDEYTCESFLQEREIKYLVSAEEFERHLARSLKQVENQSKNSFHCKTPDCPGWCLVEDDVNTFFCNVCNRKNCLTCAAIHEGKNCKQYQDKLDFYSDTSKDARKTREYLAKQIKNNLAMECPTCQVIVMKREGCDWLLCSMCRTEICWATKGPRWGQGGRGDTSGGCGCDMRNRKYCHKSCRGCH